MIKRLSSIRFSYIRSHLHGLFLTAIMILSILLSIYVLFEPYWLDVTNIFVFVLLYVFLGFIIAFYVGFKSSSELKERLDHLSVLITQFSNGNYNSRIYANEDDEITRIGQELNELGEKLQNQVKSLRRMADEKAEYAKSAHKTAVIEERQRLARDLHDAVSQQLFALTMMSEAASKQIEMKPSIAKNTIQDIAQAALKAQSEMRALLLHLRPVNLSGEPLAVGIQKLLDELRQKSTIDFQFVMDDDLHFSETTAEHVFRIVQESLSNILRHAEATLVKISVTKRGNELFLYISDNGRGFNVEHDSNRKTSYGMKTMKERAEELGGTFSVKSVEGEGTYIDIRIPL